MLVDVLKRYLLIVWNFFFGQISSESIQDGPKDVPTDSAADVVPPVDADSNDDEIVNEDDDDDEDIEETFDDEEDEECEEDENEEVDVVVPKAPETKVITNDDVPAAKPSGPVKKIEEIIKDPEVPTNKVKDNVKPELPKDVEIKEKPKTVASDVPEKNETPPPNKSKPEFEFVEREASAAAKVVTPEKDASKLQQADFEIVEREGSKVVPPPEGKEETSKSKHQVEIKEKDVAKVVPAEKDTVKLKQAEVEVKDKESPKLHPDTKPKDEVNKMPEKVGGGGVHVKFEDDEVKVPAKSPVSPPPPTTTSTLLPDVDGKSGGGDGETNANNFVVLEKGEVTSDKKNADDGLKKPDHAIDSFLSGEQKHSSRVQQQHPESIQDQQL